MWLSKNTCMSLYNDFCQVHNLTSSLFRLAYLDAPEWAVFCEDNLTMLQEDYYLLSILLPAMKENELVYALVLDEFYVRLAKHFG